MAATTVMPTDRLKTQADPSDDMADSGSDPEDLYSVLGVPTAASHAEIVDAYKREVLQFEEVSKLGKKNSVFKEAEKKHKEVSKAFFVLSDASHRQSYNDSGVFPDSPKPTRRSRQQGRDYFVKHNEQSITIFLPQNLAKLWLTTCEDLYDTKATDGGKNGHQIKTTYSDAKSSDPVGTVSIKVYETTQKMLIQGSAYLLWFSEVFPLLRKKINPTSVRAVVPFENLSSGDTSEPESVANPSICQSCDQPLSSDVCPLCNTVPKDVLGVNSNALSSHNHESQTDYHSIRFNAQVQDSVNKLETCLIDSIADRKMFEDSVSQRLSALETKQNSCQHSCDNMSVEEGRKLRDDIVRLEGVKCDLERQIGTLRVQLEELTAIVQNTSVKVKSTESQTTDEHSTAQDSERVNKLLHEVATVNVQNRFAVLSEVSDPSDTDSSRPVSKHGAQDADSKANQSAREVRREVPVPDETIKTNQQNKDTPPDILILGDSNTRALKADILYPNKRVRKELAFNLTESTEFIQRSKLPEPKVILFHVGTNDIRDTPDATKVSEGFRKLIQTTHDKYPNSSIVMSSVLPRDAPALQDVGNDVNSFLKVVADETSYVHTIDNSNFADSGAIKSALYSPDGYHINRFGIRVLAANIKRTTNPLLGLGQYTGRKTQPAMNTVKNSQTRSYRDAVIGAPSKHPARQLPRTSMSGSSTPPEQGRRPKPTGRDLPPARQPSRTSMHGPSPTPDHGRHPTPTGPPVTGCELRTVAPRQVLEDKETTRPTSQRPGHTPTTPWRHIPPTPNQLPGPWCPPMFNQPAGPWGFPPTSAPGPSLPRQPPRFNPPPWPWHPSMMWHPMFPVW
ncbi:hypothetical protein Bbelb_254190 [Branchiostoma belcheri]|nr:hypothetical protein Bbelb_254190 [Branchiostoma belcheri]